MHISQFKLVPEFWVKKKNGIIFSKIKIDLVSESSICYTICFQYACLTDRRPARLNHFFLIMNYPTKACQSDLIKGFEIQAVAK